jgi:hypothetical protein
MPINIYVEGKAGKKVAWLGDGDWTLPGQIYALEEWLKLSGKHLAKDSYIADVGFKWRRDAGGGGSALSPKAMKIMADIGMSLFLSEYQGFANEEEEQPNQPSGPRV